MKRSLSENFDQHNAQWAPWHYNNTIGWIRIFLLGDQIRGDYYFIDAKRISKSLRQKRYRYHLKAFEILYFQGQNIIGFV